MKPFSAATIKATISNYAIEFLGNPGTWDFLEKILGISGNSEFYLVLKGSPFSK